MSRPGALPDDPQESAYDRAVGQYTSLVAPALIELVEVRTGDRVLDVGCGTGVMSLEAARMSGSTGEVVGVDSEHRQLEIARRKADELRLGVRFEEADAHELLFPLGSFDVVICGFALMFLAHQGDVLLRFHDLLRMHGRVGLATWSHRHDSELWMKAIRPLEDHMTDEERALSQRPYLLDDREELRDMLYGAGFGRLRVESYSVKVEYQSPHDVWNRFCGERTLRGRKVAQRDPEGYVAARERALRVLERLGPWPHALGSVAILARGERVV